MAAMMAAQRVEQRAAMWEQKWAVQTAVHLVESMVPNLAAQTVDNLVGWTAALSVVRKVVPRAGTMVVRSDKHWAE